MRTRISCGWLVAHADGNHTLWRNAELVYEGNTVLFVGERFEGLVDHEIDARDKLEHFSIRLGVSRVREISVAFFFGNTFEK
jgi:hypothetical protein